MSSDSGAQIKNILAVVKKLEEAWNEGSRTYHVGWNDDRVAKETKLSIQLVKQVREEECGPLVDPEVLSIRSELDGLRSMIGELDQKLSRFEQKRKIA